MAQELSRPQAKYFLYYPATLAAAALLLWLFPTDLMTGVSTAIAAVVSCLMMWEFLFLNRVVRLTTVCAMGLTIGYGAGTLNSWLTIPRGNGSLASVVGQTPPEMANGVAAALLGCAVLLALGELLETPVLTMAQDLTISRGVKNVLFMSSSIVVLAVAGGLFHQGGIKASSHLHAGVVAIFLYFLLPPTVVLVTVALLIEKDKRQKYLLGGVTVFLWLLLMTQGRRDLVYPALITVGLARYFGYKWGTLNWRRLLLAGIAIAFLFMGVLTYQLMREAGIAISSHSIGGEARQIAEWEQQGVAWRIAATSSAQNVKGRTLIVVFLDDLLYREQTASPAFGKDLAMQVEVEIPSLLLRNKIEIGEENLASETFHVFYPDLANSLFTAGALDFGIWGIMVYPIVTLLLFSAFLRLAITYSSPEVYLFGLVAFMDIAMAAEVQLAGYLGIMRNLLIFAAFLYVASRLPVLKWRSDL